MNLRTQAPILPGARVLLQKYPGIQQDGNYSYENPSYSIFNVSIQEGDLLRRVLEFMLEIRSEVKHPEMKKIIDRISQALPEISSAKEAGTSFLSALAPLKKSIAFGKDPEIEEDLLREDSLMKEPDDLDELHWSLILNVI